MNLEEHEERKIGISETQKRIENKVFIEKGNETDLKESRNVGKNENKNVLPNNIKVW